MFHHSLLLLNNFPWKASFNDVGCQIDMFKIKNFKKEKTNTRRTERELSSIYV